MDRSEEREGPLESKRKFYHKHDTISTAVDQDDEHTNRQVLQTHADALFDAGDPQHSPRGELYKQKPHKTHADEHLPNSRTLSIRIVSHDDHDDTIFLGFLAAQPLLAGGDMLFAGALFASGLDWRCAIRIPRA
jgi:hypothetical protein